MKHPTHNYKWSVGQVLQYPQGGYWKVISHETFIGRGNVPSYDVRKCSASGLEYKARNGYTCEYADTWRPVTLSAVGEKASTEGISVGIHKRRLSSVNAQLKFLMEKKIELEKILSTKS